METYEELKKINKSYFKDDLYVAPPLYAKNELVYASMVGLATKDHTAWVNALTFKSLEISSDELFTVIDHLLKWYPEAKDYIEQHERIKLMESSNESKKDSDGESR